VSILSPFVITWALLAVRLAVVFGTTPVFEQFPVPALVRACFVFAFSAALAAALPPSRAMADPSAGHLFRWAIEEALAGGLLALCINIGFGAFSMGARLIDIQIGFGISQVFDPFTRRDTPVLSALFANFAVLAFFLSGGYVVMLRAFAYLVSIMPPGADALPHIDVHAVLQGGARLFVTGLALVSPVVLCVLIVEAALVLAARGLPRMNVFVVGMPIKIVTGLVSLSFWLPHARDPIGHALGAGFDIFRKALD
jgi:flagellar biosynthetic protein FliR